VSDRLDDVVERLVRIEDKLDAKIEDITNRLVPLEQFLRSVKQAVAVATRAFGWLVATTIAVATVWLTYLGVKK